MGVVAAVLFTGLMPFHLLLAN